MPDSTRAEAYAAAATIAPASVILTVYLIDRAGGPIAPWPMLAIGLGAAAAAIGVTWRHTARDTADIATFSSLVLGLFAWLLWIARPDFLPLGRGTDLTHHLLLVDYIERHWALVHDRAVGLYMGEMTVYTPGSHILAAVAGAWTRTSGTHVLHAMMASAVALKVGFVYLIARRALPPTVPRAPLAGLAALTHVASLTFFLGSFTAFSFVAQVVSEWFAVAMWWAVTAWNDERHPRFMVLAGVFGAASFLSWPVVMGPPALLLGLLVIMPGVRGLFVRARHALIAFVIIASIAVLFASDRTDMVRIVGTGGTATAPAVAQYGWPFLVASLAGLGLAAFIPRARSVALFALALAAQMTALWAYARWHGNVPYMAQKMFYLALSVQAVGVAIGLGVVWRIVFTRSTDPRLTAPGAAATRAAWMCALAAAVLLLRPLTREHVPFVTDRSPAVVLPIERAGLWARANLPVQCIEYLVGNDDTAYWLHLAVLGNPRLTRRTAEPTTFELTPALLRWLTPGGRPYAIADLPSLPASVRDELDVVQRFDSAAVVRRRGPSACAEGR